MAGLLDFIGGAAQTGATVMSEKRKDKAEQIKKEAMAVMNHGLRMSEISQQDSNAQAREGIRNQNNLDVGGANADRADATAINNINAKITAAELDQNQRLEAARLKQEQDIAAARLKQEQDNTAAGIDRAAAILNSWRSDKEANKRAQQLIDATDGEMVSVIDQSTGKPTYVRRDQLGTQYAGGEETVPFESVDGNTPYEDFDKIGLIGRYASPTIKQSKPDYKTEVDYYNSEIKTLSTHITSLEKEINNDDGMNPQEVARLKGQRDLYRRKLDSVSQDRSAFMSQAFPNMPQSDHVGQENFLGAQNFLRTRLNIIQSNPEVQADAYKVSVEQFGIEATDKAFNSLNLGVEPVAETPAPLPSVGSEKPWNTKDPKPNVSTDIGDGKEVIPVESRIDGGVITIRPPNFNAKNNYEDITYEGLNSETRQAIKVLAQRFIDGEEVNAGRGRGMQPITMQRLAGSIDIKGVILGFDTDIGERLIQSAVDDIKSAQR